MLEQIWPAIFGLVGVLLGSILSHIFDQKQQKKQASEEKVRGKIETYNEILRLHGKYKMSIYEFHEKGLKLNMFTEYVVPVYYKNFQRFNEDIAELIEKIIYIDGRQNFYEEAEENDPEILYETYMQMISLIREELAKHR